MFFVDHEAHLTARIEALCAVPDYVSQLSVVAYFAAVTRSQVEIVLIPSTAPGVREGVDHEIRRL